MIALFRAVLLSSAVISSQFSGLAMAAEFNDTQRTEMGEIIHDYLMKNPEVLRDAFQELERKSAEEQQSVVKDALASNKDALFHNDGDEVIGNPQGDITLVEFFDYNCGYCKKAAPDVEALINDDKKLRVVLKEFPIFGGSSITAAKAALAARKQDKYVPLHNALMAQRGKLDDDKIMAIAEKIGLDMTQLAKDMDAPEITKIIEENHELAMKLQIQGTPAFIIDETLVPGAVGKSTLAAIIGQVREQGCKLC